ncbi:PREDICTED: uncharacterized protein LOC105555908, partial [Vollenhovia emeryi]|uniref:uncharacterized protein LOC105555908 n=1 Tax=Vollenhovia emeryi TaxID=411798 RepID=UPI0005F42BD4
TCDNDKTNPIFGGSSRDSGTGTTATNSDDRRDECGMRALHGTGTTATNSDDRRDECGVRALHGTGTTATNSDDDCQHDDYCWQASLRRETTSNGGNQSEEEIQRATGPEDATKAADDNDDGAKGGVPLDEEDAWQGGEETDERERSQALQRELEICQREKDVTERELAITRREIELLRMTQNNNTTNAAILTTRAPSDVPLGNSRGTEVRGANQQSTIAEDDSLTRTTKVNVAVVADLLKYFNGDTKTFETWEKQVRFLSATYKLNNDLTKILIGTRLKGRALDWFHSRHEYMEMTPDTLLDNLRGMFHRQPNKLAMRKRFEERTWKRDETFHDYVHEKTIMANRIAIPDDEVLGYVIEGIPDPELRDLARVQGFTTRDEILTRFSQISLRDKGYTAATTASSKGDDRSGGAKRKADKSGKSNANEKPVADDEKNPSEKKGRGTTKRCYSCGLKDHVSANCPTKEKGNKCFECREYGHIASKCPNKGAAKDSCAIAQTHRRKRFKSVSVNDVVIQAIIDSGSDITIMRKDEYAKIGSPRFEFEGTPFRGIGTAVNTTEGGFRAKLTVDGNCYTISIHVVSDELLRYNLLIGSDFLDTVDVHLRRGEPTIIKPSSDGDGNSLAEVCQISVVSDREGDTVDVSHVHNAEYKQIVKSVVDSYRPNRIRETGIKMKLVLKDDDPVCLSPRRLAMAERNEINAQIDEWLENGIVRPSVSDYASPVVLAKKKDGSNRLCVDYRLLNKKIVRDRYPLPLIEDQLDALQNATVFSTLDLKNGFFHVRMDESSVKYTAFVVPDGHYEFLRVPFGLCNSPAVFQRFVNTVFRDLVRNGDVLVYMDDLIIPSIDCEVGLEKLKRVLSVASENGLEINWKKCSMLRASVEYLGHTIENGCIRPSERKTEAVKRFPALTCVRQVQSFLGLTGYFRKFVRGYSVIARPLTDMLRATATFKFGEKEQSAVDQLKLALTDKPVLNLYRVGAETELHTDASMHGYGAILLQRNSDDDAMHPIYYASGKTTPAEEKYPSHELEVLAIVKALRKFRVYLLGIDFKIVTDCRAFTQTMSKRDLCVRVARWALMLEEFRYEIEHRPGKSMSHVDALSRNPLPACLLIDGENSGLTAKLGRAQRDDVDINRILQLPEEKRGPGYAVRGGLLFKEVDGDIRLMVPKTMCSQIIRRAHERGHFAAAKTEAIVRRDYYIQNLRLRVEKVVRNCIDCILAEKKQGKQEGFLSPLDKGDTPLDTFHIIWGRSRRPKRAIDTFLW